MDKDSIAHKIAKFKARRLKTRLAHYCALSTIFLTLSIFATGIRASSLLTFLIILPIPLYFIRESVRLSRKNKQLQASLSSLYLQFRTLEARFSLISFLTQPSPIFRLSLAMIIIIVITTVARIHSSTIHLSSL